MGQRETRQAPTADGARGMRLPLAKPTGSATLGDNCHRTGARPRWRGRRRSCPRAAWDGFVILKSRAAADSTGGGSGLTADRESA
jgi:hypothetical protein